MRYDTPVYFQTVVNGTYEPTTGDYNADTITEAKRYAAISNTVDSALKLVYGDIKQGSLTIRLQNHYTQPFDRIRIGEKLYRVDSVRKLRTKHTFIVSEVQ